MHVRTGSAAASPADSSSAATALSGSSASPVVNLEEGSQWGDRLAPFYDYWGQTKDYEENGLERSEPTEKE